MKDDSCFLQPEVSSLCLEEITDQAKNSRTLMKGLQYIQINMIKLEISSTLRGKKISQLFKIVELCFIATRGQSCF